MAKKKRGKKEIKKLVVTKSAKKEAPKKETAKKETIRKIPLKTDISSLEDETMKRVEKTLSTLENFLSRWNSSKVKPGNMIPQIMKIRNFYEGLSAWHKNALEARKGKENEQARLRRLRDFVSLCRNYS